MARYKHYDYAQTMLVAVSLADQLQAGTLEHTIHYVVEERLDLSGFDQEGNQKMTWGGQARREAPGCPCYDINQ